MKSIQKILLAACTAMLFVYCSKEQPQSLVPKTADQDPSISSISVNGARLHSEAFGHPDSTMVVMIHGGPGGDYRDMLNAKALASHGYRVVFYDQRGSGLSQRFSMQSYTNLGMGALNMMYDELAGVIAEYRTKSSQKVFLLGHSWGGILASGFAGKYPDKVNGLVVAEPGGLKWEDIKEYVGESRSFSLWGETLNDASYLDQFLTGKEDQHEILDYKAAMTGSVNEITGENSTTPGSFWRAGAVVNSALFKIGEKHFPDFSAGLNNFNVPVLFIYSEKNKAYPLSWAQKISAAYNTADLFKVNGVGHGGIIKDNQAWTQQVMPKLLSYFATL